MRSITTVVVTAAVLGALVAAGASAASHRAGSCTAGLRAGVRTYCGPASGRLTAFAGVAFRGGSCRTYKVGGVPYLEVAIGSRAIRDAARNGGRTYLGVTVVGPLSKPKSGLVFAYSKGKRYIGNGRSFKKSGTGGTFTTVGPTGSASGSFRC